MWAWWNTYGSLYVWWTQALCVSVPFVQFVSFVWFLPDSFLSCIISPLVKCSSGNLNDVNNYQTIALSNTFSKIFESVLFWFIDGSHKTDDYQFGFRKKHSTAQYTDVFKRTVHVDYYTQRGSHVFSCFIDFNNKAFESMDILQTKLVILQTNW